jgi:hypothetical protein
VCIRSFNSSPLEEEEEGEEESKRRKKSKSGVCVFASNTGRGCVRQLFKPVFLDAIFHFFSDI